MRVLVLSGIALMAAGGILLVIALRMRDPQSYYRWLIPRPGTPPGLDPLPDESWVRWEDPEAAAAEIARVEGAARHARVLPSRYSRVIPSEPPGAERTATPSTGSPGQRPEPATDVHASFFEQTLRILREDRRRAPTPPGDR